MGHEYTHQEFLQFDTCKLANFTYRTENCCLFTIPVLLQFPPLLYANIVESSSSRVAPPNPSRSLQFPALVFLSRSPYFLPLLSSPPHLSPVKKVVFPLSLSALLLPPPPPLSPVRNRGAEQEYAFSPPFAAGFKRRPGREKEKRVEEGTHPLPQSSHALCTYRTLSAACQDDGRLALVTRSI